MTATYSRTAGETVGSPYIISATLAPAAVLGNYDITANTASFDIAKKAASVTPRRQGKTYGAADPTLTGALVGFLAADGVTATYSRTAGETVGSPTSSARRSRRRGCSATTTSRDDTASFDIAKKAASVTPAAASKTYGAADPALTGALDGFLAADNVTATYSRTAGETVGQPTSSARRSRRRGCSATTTSRYNTASFDIAKKTASVTPAAAGKTYGAADPTLTGALVGFLAADNVTATYSRTAGETVAGAYMISATLAPAAVLGNYDITSNTASFDIDEEGGVGDAGGGEQDLRRGGPDADRRARRLPGRRTA